MRQRSSETAKHGVAAGRCQSSAARREPKKGNAWNFPAHRPEKSTLDDMIPERTRRRVVQVLN